MRQQHLGQRLQPAFAGNLGAGLAFGLVGAVEVLQRLERGRGVELRGQRVGELLLAGDLSLDGLPPPGQPAQILQAGLDVPDLHLVQPAGDLLAVARDEGEGVAVDQQRDRGGDLGEGDFEFCGDERMNG